MLDIKLRAQLVTLYSEPQRVYHSYSHILHLLRELQALSSDKGPKPSGLNYDAIEYAIWFHDVVYDPMATGGQNEKMSADIAYEYLKGRHPNFAIDVSDMILETANHGVTPLGQKLSVDTEVFLDIDLSILGQEWYMYSKYMKDVRAEYASIGDELFNAGRLAFLKKIIASQKPFYHTKYYQDKYEAQARENIQNEIDILSSKV